MFSYFIITRINQGYKNLHHPKNATLANNNKQDNFPSNQKIYKTQITIQTMSIIPFQLQPLLSNHPLLCFLQLITHIGNHCQPFSSQLLLLFLIVVLAKKLEDQYCQ